MAVHTLLPAEHWRDRAVEARAMAEQLRDSGARLALLKIAEGYEKLAQRADLRALVETVQAPPPRQPRRASEPAQPTDFEETAGAGKEGDC